MELKKKDVGSTDQLTARASLSTYLVFSSILAPLFVLVAIATIKSPQSWSVVVIVGLVAAGCGVWIRSFRLVVSDETLVYRSLFGGTRSIQLSEIGKAETKLASSDALGPFMQLRIIPKHGLRRRPIVVNMKVFSRNDLRALFEILGPKMTG